MSDNTRLPAPEPVPRRGLLLTAFALSLWLALTLFAHPLADGLAKLVNTLELRWLAAS